MNRKLIIGRNTCLALASGLFTGGVVTHIVAKELAKEVLINLFFPAIVLYFFYTLTHVVEDNPNLKVTDPYTIISFLIGLLFAIHIIFF